MAVDYKSSDGEGVISGMCVACEVKDTCSERGLGLFTLECIPKGALVWQPLHALLRGPHQANSDKNGIMTGASNLRLFGKDDAIALMENPDADDQEKEDFFRKSYGDVSCAHTFGKPDEGVMFLPRDESQYVNHAAISEATIGSWFHVFASPEDIKTPGSIMCSFALRDIQPGEELVEDYGEFEVTAWFVELAKEHGMMPTYYEMKPHKMFLANSSCYDLRSLVGPSDDELPPSYDELEHSEAAMDAAMVLSRLREGDHCLSATSHGGQ